MLLSRITKAWGGAGELELEDGQQFTRRECEASFRQMFSLEEDTLKCDHRSKANLQLLQKAQKRLLAVSRSLPGRISAQVDGLGRLALDRLLSSTWVAKPTCRLAKSTAESRAALSTLSLQTDRNLFLNQTGFYIEILLLKEAHEDGRFGVMHISWHILSVAQWYPFPFFGGSRSPDQATNPQKRVPLL